ncbi:hypothetical protein BDY19DRAFT_920390 [Irpex rosettiformis]|uniref:Uncharacterized protein n=1 Tax=Irpex rosettiformis TaxID=378272 RepID=A0ACB8UIU7_9APHY|nr:hypothetical protein BDY19DRAFT_920390 [Irpex rosettiformis]
MFLTRRVLSSARCLSSRPCVVFTRNRSLWAPSTTSLNEKALDEWVASDKTLAVSDTLHPEHLSDLYITLPTRDGSIEPYHAPQIGEPLPYGHHFAFFHPRNPESLLRSDGTDADFCPPEPFTRRMWAGGSIRWKLWGKEGLHVGDSVKAVTRIKDVKKKGFNRDGTPMVFVKQLIEYSKEGSDQVAIEEERSHVYLAAPAHRRPVKEVEQQQHIVERGPLLNLEFTPSSTTLFRFSALTFNGHLIHLDKDYARSEGYPERLVHGPLSALMLLELVNYGLSMEIGHFEYRAYNPMLVNRPIVLNAQWNGQHELALWAADKETGTIGMAGSVWRRGI